MNSTQRTSPAPSGPELDGQGPVDTVRRALLAAGAQDTVVVLATDVPTAAAAAQALGCEVGAIANSLVFQCGGAPLLILASGAAKVDTTLVARMLGLGKISGADPDFVFAHTGQRVGGVAPLAHPEKIRTIVDTDLARHPLLWAGAGTHQAMFSIGYDQLVAITGGQPSQVRKSPA